MVVDPVLPGIAGIESPTTLNMHVFGGNLSSWRKPNIGEALGLTQELTQDLLVGR